MTLEIIIIAIFASAAMLAAILAVHNVQELRDTRIKYDAAQTYKSQLEVENEQLESKAINLERALIAEQKNSKELRQIIIDYEIAANLQQESESESEPGQSDMPLPDSPTNIISMEPTRIFDKYNEWDGTAIYKNAFTQGTDQELLQRDCFTETEGIFKGVRYYEFGGVRAYCSALSTNYTSEIGTVFEIELENGYVFDVICADYKNPLQDPRLDWLGTPCTNYDGQLTTCIVEFVVDMEQIPEEVTAAGTFTVLEELGGLHGTGGNVKSIKKLGRWWEP